MAYPKDPKMIDKILRLPEVKNQTGAKRTTIYNRIAQGLITKPISLGGRTVGWPESEIAKINGARIAGRSEDEVRTLVQRLHEVRIKAAA